ncbi:hypothetical protein Hanom_Chr10g00962501 [Helianthus anomalus]
MESNELLSNLAALGILVITLVVNVCIQMQTGAVSISTHNEDPRIIQLTSPTHISIHPNPVLPFRVNYTFRPLCLYQIAMDTL